MRAEKGQASLEVEPTTRLSFEPTSFDWEGGLEVELRPFCWNGLSLLLSGDAIAPAPLVRWFKKWFDEDDERAVLPNGLCGVVHFLSDPRPTNGGVRFEADFGSAPVEAFEERLDACREAGAQSVGPGDLETRRIHRIEPSRLDLKNCLVDIDGPPLRMARVSRDCLGV